MNKIDYSNNGYNKYICSSCKTPCFRKKYGLTYGIYVDLNNKRIWGLKCHSCYLNKCRVKYISKDRPVYNKKCQFCFKSFTTINNNKLCCSNNCIARPRVYKKVIVHCSCGIVLPPKLKIKKCFDCRITSKPIHKCLVCSKSLSKSVKFCSRKCNKANYRNKNKDRLKQQNKKYAKHYKTLRKRGVKQAKPPWMSVKEIMTVYVNCPKNMQVDHIIPLNHMDVCGLHVPWNLQYLSPEDNNKKSNKFDGTYVNNSWLK